MCVSQVSENAELHKSYMHNCKTSLIFFLCWMLLLSLRIFFVLYPNLSQTLFLFLHAKVFIYFFRALLLTSEPELHSMLSQIRVSKNQKNGAFGFFFGSSKNASLNEDGG